MLTETRGFASVAERNAFYKKAASLILPMALQNLINVGVTATDIILLGKVGETVLSGRVPGRADPVYHDADFFRGDLGASVLIAQYWGKKDVDAIEKVMGIALKIAVVTGALFTAAALFFPDISCAFIRRNLRSLRKGSNICALWGFPIFLMRSVWCI